MQPSFKIPWASDFDFALLPKSGRLRIIGKPLASSPLARPLMSEYSLGTVEVSLGPLERFEEYLQSKGKRITQQRKHLVERVFSHHDHFDAEDLIGFLGRGGKSLKISRPTVYRTLGELVEAGLLRKLDLGGRAVYEHDYGYPQHDHLHCEECNRLIEFRSDQIREIGDAVALEHGFRVSGHRLIISGVCDDCLKKRLRKRSRLDRI